jgi:hypothetical protein
MPVRSIHVNLKLPFLEVGGQWEPDDTEARASWEMYVELVTRISVAELRPGEGLLREALTSLYSLFGTTREILRRYGPNVARNAQPDRLSFGYIAVAVLNGALRPVLASWHPRLLAYEITRPPEVTPPEHEAAWADAEQLRETLNRMRRVLLDYAAILADAADAPSLLQAISDTEPSARQWRATEEPR